MDTNTFPVHTQTIAIVMMCLQQWFFLMVLAMIMNMMIMLIESVQPTYMEKENTIVFGRKPYLRSENKANKKTRYAYVKKYEVSDYVNINRVKNNEKKCFPFHQTYKPNVSKTWTDI